MWWRIILTWVLFLPVPIINGLLREGWYKLIVGEILAHQIGSIIISGIFLVYVYIFWKNSLLNLSPWQLLIISSSWVIMTLIFEFGIGLANGRTWNYMLADYNVMAGRLWVFVLLTIFLSPWLIKMLLNK